MPKRKHQFTLTVDLGNEAMRTGQHLCATLRRLAALIEEYDSGNIAAGSVMDANGLKVGRWTLDLPGKE
jgi:hypothetical protein